MSADLVTTSQNFDLSEIAEYVSRIAVTLNETIAESKVRELIDGYGYVIIDDFLPDYVPVDQAANGLVMLDRKNYPKQRPTQSLYNISNYIVSVILELGHFGYDFDDAIETIDDYSDVLISWSRMISPRTAARRLVAHDKRAAAGGMNES